MLENHILVPCSDLVAPDVQVIKLQKAKEAKEAK